MLVKPKLYVPASSDDGCHVDLGPDFRLKGP